jgi:hypothetical protein
MPAAKKIAREQLTEYFYTFTKRFLLDESPEAVDLEVMSRDWGDHPALSGARLLGISYDPHTPSLEFTLDVGDHRVLDPRDVWVEEDATGFVHTLELIRADGTRELVSIKRLGGGLPEE